MRCFDHSDSEIIRAATFEEAIDKGLNQSISHMMDLSAESVLEAARSMLAPAQTAGADG